MVTKQDEDELLEILKSEHKLCTTELVPIPLASEHLPEAVGGSAVVTLNRVFDLQRVNRLAPGETVEFAPSGLTVIYGANGSGKSGYIRVLKAICRAKGAEEILPDVFQKPPQEAPASAKVAYHIKGENKERTADWEAGKSAPGELSQVSIFDRHSASIYVDSLNELKVVPHNLDCFEKLAALSDSLKAKLESEQAALVLSTSLPVVNLPVGTPAREFLDQLAAKSAADVEGFAVFTQEDEARLLELENLVNDPQAQLAQLLAARQAAASIKAKTEAALVYLSPTGVAQMQATKAALAAATLAAEVAAEISVHEEGMLPGAGSELWSILFDAAKRFSEEEAYPDKPFPYVDHDAQCVLCHQHLDPPAKARFVRFADFVADEAATKLAQASEAWASQQAGFRNAVAELEGLDLQIIVIQARAPVLAAALNVWLSVAGRCAEEIHNHILQGAPGEVSQFPSNPASALAAFAEGVEAAKTETEAAISGESITALKVELAALQALKLLVGSKAQLLARLEQLERISRLGDAIKACDTTQTSKQGTRLLKEYVTDTLATELATERKGLRVEHIPLTLYSKGEKGTAKHRLRLNSETYRGSTSHVLSEGEHRAMALAVFLAEQTVLSATAPIVIDDPVSSLDHRRTAKVASRLVQEAKMRQVVVFTHDLLFYTTVEAECARQQVPLVRTAVLNTANRFGLVDPDGDPWTAKSLARRYDWLSKQLARAKKQHEDGDVEGYERDSQFFYARLRPTWERLVEEALFANVVVRFRLGVQTLGLKSAVMDDDLYKAIYDAMTEISAFTAHDGAAIPNAPWPEPDEMKAHLERFKSCWDDIKGKAKLAEKAREALTKPPVPAAAS